MRRFLIGLLAAIGGLALLVIVGIGVAAWLFWPRGAPELPERIVLTVDLREGFPEVEAGDPLVALGFRRELTLIEALLALEQAQDDPRVQGLFATLGGEGPGYAQAQELRAAIQGLQGAGKFTLAYADSFGEFGPGTRGYYLASAFDEIYLQPLGALGLTGLLIETPLLRGLFDKLGIKPAGDKRGAYKNAADVFLERTLTPEHRESLQSLVDSLDAQVRAGIGEGRGLDPAALRDLIDQAPYAAEQALTLGLVDRLGYWDEAAEDMKGRAGAQSVRVPLEDYVAAARTPVPEDAPVIALVQGVGMIQGGDSEEGPVRGLIMGADTTADAIAQAAEDPAVGAILFRIDTPGGSAVASETIGYEVRRAVKAGKPVIVSMGEVAASGGYWIATGATSIVARPATLTGSIGVFAGKPVLAEFWNELGVNWALVQRGANADMWSMAVDFDAAGEAQLNAFLDRTYDAFIDRVAQGRDMARADVLAIAGGRVWTGAQALEVGLIDDAGGFMQALALAKEAAGAAPDEPVELRGFPAPRPPWERLFEMLANPAFALEDAVRLLERLPSALLWTPPLDIR